MRRTARQTELRPLAPPQLRRHKPTVRRRPSFRRTLRLVDDSPPHANRSAQIIGESAIVTTNGIATSPPCWPQFRMLESFDLDGVLRLTLFGELDLAVVDELKLRLEQLRRTGERVRVDLSQLEFIDGTGLSALARGVWAGRSPGGDLVQVDPNLSRPVRRVCDLVGLGAVFWPTDRVR
jgi:anti-anti-sigma factor